MNLKDKIELAIQRGNVQGAKKLLDIHYKQEDKQSWDESKRAEYELLFPTYREMTDEEYKEWYTENVVGSLEERDEDILSVPIDYISIETVTDEDGNTFEREIRTPSNYLTYDEWLNETKVLTEAVEEVSHLDDDGMKVIDTPYQPEVTEQLRPYIAPDTADRIDAYIGSKYKELRAKEYPSMTDYLDALVKGDTEAQQEYIDACLAVKAKYPKPEVQDA